MKVVKTRRKKFSWISFNRDSIFRDDVVVLGKGHAHVVFMTTFNNSFKTYEIISSSVPNGTYKIKVISVDDLYNQNTGVEDTVVVDFFPLPPVNLSGSVTGSNVTLTWQHSANGAPDNYIIYGNGGSGSIDRSTIIATVAGSATSHTFSVANGDWRFVVEAKEGTKESSSMFIEELTVPSTDTKPKEPGVPGTGPFAVTGLMLENISVGKVKVSFLWFHGTNASKFRIFHDDGTGTIDFGTHKFEFTRQNKMLQTYTTTQLHSVDQNVTYKFVVRSVSPDSIESENENIYQIDVDGVEPDDAVNLNLDTVF